MSVIDLTIDTSIAPLSGRTYSPGTQSGASHDVTIGTLTQVYPTFLLNLGSTYGATDPCQDGNSVVISVGAALLP